ncbi:UNVERIFIED_CONTAM: hypothetical protein Sradi_0206900 [Sesamum radiatum]|uniref:Reverse transcriptase domain-containing protein n=1 Tax=Sesamum radiatum TaxID=300843 RepID=A0AAW2W1F5_SESRA
MRSPLFSWHNKSEGRGSIWKRLDRVVTNDIWLEKWPSQYYLCTTPRTSDHSPVILYSEVQACAQLRREKGNLHDNVTAVAEFLASAQQLKQQFMDDSFLSRLEKYCMMVYSKAVQLEHSSLKQHAKFSWLKDGDACSRVFFRKVAAGRAASKVFQIHTSFDELLTDQEDVIAEFVSFYQLLLGGTPRRTTVDFEHLTLLARYRLRPAEAQALEAWSVVGVDVIAALHEFYTSGRILKQLNATLLCLVPKVEMPHGVTECRSIACCNVLYKIITKLLVARMTSIMSKIFSNNKNFFVLGRSISDNIMIAQELFPRYNKKRFPPSCALKVDLKKAFDSVEWDFLEATLRVCNFPPRFIAWIMECVTTVTFSISLNGSTHGFFKGARGLRQGGPCLPTFLLCVYWSSAYILPKGIIKVLEKKIKQFLWKGNNGTGYAKIANGHKFWLWRDPWHPFGRLGIQFPLAPAVTGFSYDSMLSSVILQGHWTWPSFSDPNIITIMEVLPPITVGEDVVHWKFGHFSTSSAYHFFNYSVRKVTWGLERYRGKHLISASYRATLASLVYHIWKERNGRRFSNITTTPEAVAL